MYALHPELVRAEQTQVQAHIQKEIRLLGRILSGQARHLPNLNPYDFWALRHQKVWKAIVALRYLKTPVSVRSVRNWLAAHGQLRQCGGEEYLAWLAGQAD